MPSAERFCESRMRDILTSGSTRGEAVVPTVSLPLLLYLKNLGSARAAIRFLLKRGTNFMRFPLDNLIGL